MIRVRQLCKSYRVGDHRLDVLRGVNLDIERGELVSIMGASGSGKSTLLNMLGLLDRFDSGEYELAGRAVAGLSARELARIRNEIIGFVFQAFHLLAFKTAVENVALPLYYRGVSRRKRQRAAMEALESVGLADWAGHRPTQLSGGQQQRVALARAVVGRPQMILADEPTGALDSETSARILELFESLHREGMTVILVTHDAEVAAQTQRLISMRDGQIEDPS